MEKTKYRLAYAIKTLMEKQALDKITVTDIVAQCEMTRQTFYRNFKDKYDLVNWYFEKLAQKSFKQMGISCSLEEGLVKKFNFIKEEIHFFREAFRSKDYNSLIAYDYQCIFEFYKSHMLQRNEGQLSEEIIFLLEMYCRGSIEMTVQWINQNMPMPPEKMAHLLVEALPKKLEALLLDYCIQSDSLS